MSGRQAENRRRYLHAAYVAELQTRLSVRDWAIIDSLARVRVLTGSQIERLHFADLSPLTRGRTRRGVLARLAAWGVIASLERRIGGVRGGSAGAVWSLDVAGQRLHALRSPDAGGSVRQRRPWTPGRLFLAHGLAVSEVYVSVVELSRTNGFRVARFTTEPACWWRSGAAGWLKPDALVVLDGGDLADYWWLEVDRDTESGPTLRRKLLAYVDFVNHGQRGPDDVTPRVLLTVPNQVRYQVAQRILAGLPDPAIRLVTVVEHTEAGAALVRVLRE
jgi:hypothetical protein